MEKIYYKSSIFLYASNQFCGNIEEYFSKHSKKLVVFIVMPRVKNSGNEIRIYNNGKLKEKIQVKLSENILAYYFKFLYYHWYILLSKFSFGERINIIAGHPICFFGLSIQRIVRHANHIYWVGDYFPGSGVVIKMYERLKKYYHDRINYHAYLSDQINMVFNNGKILNTRKSKTVMWGVKSSLNFKKTVIRNYLILFVGVVKDSQGLEDVFKYLKSEKNARLSIVGVCDKVLYKKYKKMIVSLGISNKVNFPNKFVEEKELAQMAKKCSVGIALYDTSRNNPTFYTDPGKIKAYAQFGLPVIMTNTSSIAPFIKKYNSGIVINKVEEIPMALVKIQRKYPDYIRGIEKFNKFFNFEKYYKDKFNFLK